MSTSIGLQETRTVWEPPPPQRLDEAVWRAWVEKGRERDKESSANRFTAVNLASLAALFVVAGLGPHLAPYDVVARFIVAVAALIVMGHAAHAGHYAFAALFAAVALLYNPVVPVFGFSAGWQRAVVLISGLPFVASLTLRKTGRDRHA
jgi:hypothetical protein